MTIYNWTSLTNGQFIAFNPLLDVLNFDDPLIWAADVAFNSSHPVQSVFTYGGKSVTLMTAPRSLSSAHVDFFNGSQFLIGDDVPGIAGDDAANALNGGSGNDFLAGLGGVDTLAGGSGNDTYVITPTATISASRIVFVEDVVSETSSAGMDTVYSSSTFALPADVEHLVLTGAPLWRPYIGTGNSLDNSITGQGSARHRLYGHDGNDSLGGGAGNDTLDGGAGTDYWNFAGAGGGVTASLATTTASGPGVGSHTLISIEGIAGSGFADNLTGDGSANRLLGGAGNDSLDGGAGSDTLDGGADADFWNFAGAGTGVTASLAAPGADTLVNVEGLIGSGYADNLTGDGAANSLLGGVGNDTLNGAAGNDTLDGGGGDDRLDGGADLDTADYSGAGAPVTVNLLLATDSASGGAGNDTLVGIENVNGSAFNDSLTGDNGGNFFHGRDGNDVLAGDNGDDTLTGGSGADFLDGSFGSDFLNGESGNDTLRGGANDDALDGGADIDTVDYGIEIIPVTVHVASFASSASIGTDFLTSIENASGSSQGDSLNGDAGVNLLAGNGGNDTLVGGGGNDTLNGGADTDTASYSNATGSVTVNLDSIAGAASGGAGNDLLISVENAIGSNSPDTLTGDGLANRLDGGAGNDTLKGAAGNDTLVGGADIDTANYGDETAAMTVNLGAGTASGGSSGTDSLTSIENVIGSGLADTITGSIDANLLNGGAGNDTLDGGSGNDTLDGGSGINVANYAGAGTPVTVNLGTFSGTGTTTGTDALYNITDVIGSDHADTLTGDSVANVIAGGLGSDTLSGGLGNDTLEGSGGNDSLVGGGGIDSVRFVEADVDLAAGTATGGSGGGNDTLVGIRNVFVTGSFDDELIGDGFNNFLSSGGGNDNLIGGAGDDTLDGGNESQNVDGSMYGPGDKASYQSESAPVVVNLATGTGGGASAGSDVLISIEHVIGSDHNDTLTGGTTNDFLSGGGGIDSLSGGDGDDYIDGQSGADRLFGGAGNDSMDGGAGGLADTDTLDGGTGTDTLAIWASVVSPVDWNVNLVTQVVTSSDGITWTISSFENVIANAGDDSITGDSIANLLIGNSGRDTLVGGVGNDTLVGGTGFSDDTTGGNRLDGGSGTDTVQYSSSVVVDLQAGTANTSTSSVDDVLILIENVIGSNLNDTLGGHSAIANFLSGREGDDRFTVVGTNDTVDGGIGADRMVADFSTSGALVIDNNPAATTTLANGVTLVGIEALSVTTGTGNDVIRNAWGVAGDSINAGGGDDVIDPGSGVDTVDGGTGTDRLERDFSGFSGTATITWLDVNGVVTTSYAQAVTWSLSSSGGTQTARNVERFLITGTSGDDLLRGGGQSDTLFGGNGNDTLEGAPGSDTLDGGGGTDLVSYAGESSAVNVNLSAGGATGGSGIDIFVSIENVFGTSFHDAVIGDDNANRLDGGAGNDTLVGFAGNDTLIGGTDIDWAEYNSDSALTIDLTAGTATSDSGTDTLSGIENVYGSYYNDLIAGNSLANRLFGNVGEDTLVGGAGNDTLDGDNGVLDTVDYSDEDNPITAILNDDGTGSVTGSTVGTDYLFLIESVIGTTSLDVIIGNNLANALIGGFGADSLSGGAGNDSLEGGAGNDTLDGGADTDYTSFASENAGVNVNLQTGTVSGGDIGLGTDTLISIEGVAGSGGDDTLTGSASANALQGGVGNDTLSGAAGNDTLEGGAGNDRLDGGADTDFWSFASATAAVIANLGAATVSGGGGLGSDTLISIEGLIGSDFADTLTGDANANVLVGRFGNDTLDGAGETDTADYTSSTGAVTVNLLTGSATGIVIGTDTLISIENVVGTNGADLLIGNSSDNLITARFGSDTLVGGAGNDTLDGGGTVGIDIADYSGETAGITVSFVTNTATGVTIGTDTLLGIEGVLATLYADSLVGGSSNDTLAGGGGNDTLNGGTAGSDTADYGSETAGVTVNLVTNSATGTSTGTDTLSSMENARGSAYSDTLIGNSLGNTLEGNAGNDTLYGAGGTDFLDGGADTDTADFSSAGAAVTANLATFTASGSTIGNDNLQNIENLTGSGSADTLTGNSLANRIDGGSGNDTISGGDGVDTLLGGANTDTVDYSYLSFTNVIVNLVTGTATVSAGNDTISGIENVYGTTTQDTLIGDSVGNLLNGGGGTDLLIGGAGNDTLDGGYLGTGIADYSGETAAVTVNLGDGTASGSSAGSDVLANIRDVIGSGNNDVITGNTDHNDLFGGDGNDTLSGGGGFSDGYHGGNGSDTVDFSWRTSSLVVHLPDFDSIENARGTGYNDRLQGDSLANRLEGAAGLDTFAGGGGNDTLDGGADSDTADYDGESSAVTVNLLSGTATGASIGTDTLVSIENARGGSEADSLTGNASGNFLESEGGNDTLSGGAGNDTLYGGSGTNYVSYSAEGDGVTVNIPLGTANGSTTGSDQLQNIANVIGSNFIDVLTGGGHMLGGGGNDVLENGTTMEGGAGDDEITGGSGDTFDGGADDDRLEFDDFGSSVTAFFMGGAGSDVLAFLGSGQSLNLQPGPGTVVIGVEVIDLSDPDSQQLTLSVNDVLAVLPEGNILRVDGDNQDQVTSTGGSWSRNEAGDQTIEGEFYQAWTGGLFTLLVDADIPNNLPTGP